MCNNRRLFREIEKTIFCLKTFYFERVMFKETFEISLTFFWGLNTQIIFKKRFHSLYFQWCNQFKIMSFLQKKKYFKAYKASLTLFLN